MSRPRKERGSLAVEVALLIPILMFAGLIAADMFRTAIERTRLEETASSLALTISTQKALTKEGLDALTEIVMQGHTEDQDILIMNVYLSGRINWLLERGGSEGLCEPSSDGRYYTGELPEDPPDDEKNKSDKESTTSFVVVKACRDTSKMFSYGGIQWPDYLQVESLYRARHQKIELDESLQEENRIAGSEE